MVSPDFGCSGRGVCSCGMAPVCYGAVGSSGSILGPSCTEPFLSGLPWPLKLALLGELLCVLSMLKREPSLPMVTWPHLLLHSGAAALGGYCWLTGSLCAGAAVSEQEFAACKTLLSLPLSLPRVSPSPKPVFPVPAPYYWLPSPRWHCPISILLSQYLL